MGAAFRRQREARRRRHQQEARVLVAGVVEGIETAHDEGVVERADRQQTHAEQRMRQPERRQQDEQVVLGDAELDVLALRRHHPALGRDHLLLAEDVLAPVAIEEAAAIDPAAEVGGDGDVRRGRDDAVGERTALAREIGEDAAEALLRRHRCRGRQRQLRRHRHPRRHEPALRARRERHLPEELQEFRGREVESGEGVPLRTVGDAVAALELGHLVGVHQAGVIVLVAGERQAEALDRVDDEADALVVCHGVEGFEQRLHVVPGQVGHEGGQTVVVMLVEQLADARQLAEIAQQMLAPAAPPLNTSAE